MPYDKDLRDLLRATKGFSRSPSEAIEDIKRKVDAKAFQTAKDVRAAEESEKKS